MKYFYCNGKKGFCDFERAGFSDADCSECAFCDGTGGEEREIEIEEVECIKTDKAERWEENMKALRAGVLGDPNATSTLLKYYRMQEDAGYPGAAENVKYYRSVLESQSRGGACQMSARNKKPRELRPCYNCGGTTFTSTIPRNISNLTFVHVRRTCTQCGAWLGGRTIKNYTKEVTDK